MDFLRIDALLTSQLPSKVVSLVCLILCNASACSVSLCLTVLLFWVNTEGIWGGQQLCGLMGAFEFVSACAHVVRAGGQSRHSALGPPLRCRPCK